MILTNHQVSMFLSEAYRQAARSPDPSNQNGAVVVTPNGSLVSVGHNGFGLLPCTEDMLKDREVKLAFIEHSERAALFDAARTTSTEGTVLVCPWVCCTDCARAIARMGVAEVICHTTRMEMTPDRWKQSVADGHSILRNYGVELIHWDGSLDLDRDFTITVNGEEWFPTHERRQRVPYL